MVREVISYYFGIEMRLKRYSLPPIFLAPVARIATDFIAPLMVAQIINEITATKPPLSTLTWYIVGFFVFPVIGEALWRYIIWSLNRADANAMNIVATETFDNLMHRSHDFHVNNFAGSLVAKTGRFISAVEPLFDTFVFEIMGTTVSLIFAVFVLTTISVPVGVIFIIVLALFLMITMKLTKNRYKLNVKRAEYESLQTGQLADSLTNAITTKTFAKEAHELKLFKKVSNDLLNRRLKSWDYQNMPMDIVTANTVFLMNTIALVGSLIAVYKVGAEIGTVFLVLAYVQRLTGKFWEFSRIMRNIETNLSNAAEMMAILKQENGVVDSKNAVPLKNVSGTISIQDVSFSYYDNKKSGLFEDLNITIEPGQTIGLVGPSGGGKTTITKLLLRFMDIRDGKILIDDQDISKVTQASLRDTITYVPQEPLLFHRTLAENISYGRPAASKEEIIEAAKKANAHDFIMQLPKKYETLVGERGIKLSGGQRQRIAIARAILKNAPIVVLDEATSALDSESEKLIQEALFKLMDGRTAIVIAHRLSTIKHLDRILVLEDGKITEDGNHDELIQKKNGTYAKLWAHQSGGFIE